MNERTRQRATWPLIVALSALQLVAASVAAADKPQQTIPDPGYRPDGYFMANFVEAFDSATIAVLPTLVRRTERTAHSFASQHQIVAYLDDKGIAASSKPKRIDLGPLRRPSQWEIFQYGADGVAEAMKKYVTETDYALVMEILIPKYQAVFGIEVYIVNQEGAHVLSFLLNEHHQMFADAKLVARNSSEEARSEMIAKATAVGLAALEKQLAQLREGVDDSE
jgi:hypothetical protein